MTYTVVIAPKKARIELYKSGQTFWFNCSNGDVVIKFAELNMSQWFYDIKGTQVEHDFELEKLELTPEQFATTKYVKSLFEKEEVVEREWSWRFPFVQKVKREVYTLEPGWHQLEETQYVEVKISKQHMTAFDYSRRAELEDAEDK